MSVWFPASVPYILGTMIVLLRGFLNVTELEPLKKHLKTGE